MHAIVNNPVPGSHVTKGQRTAQHDKDLWHPACCKASRLLSTSAIMDRTAHSCCMMLAKLDSSRASRRCCKHRTAQPLQVINEPDASLLNVRSLIRIHAAKGPPPFVMPASRPHLVDSLLASSRSQSRGFYDIVWAFSLVTLPQSCPDHYHIETIVRTTQIPI